MPMSCFFGFYIKIVVRRLYYTLFSKNSRKQSKNNEKSTDFGYYMEFISRNLDEMSKFLGDFSRFNVSSTHFVVCSMI